MSMSAHYKNELAAPVNFRKAPRLLPAFVLLSMIAHGITFLFPSTQNTPLAELHFGATLISTVLSPENFSPAKKVPPTQKTKTPQPIAQKKPETIRPERAKHNATVSLGAARKSSRIETAVESPPEKPESTTPQITSKTNTLPLPDSQRQVAQQNYLLGELQNRLRRYLTYPQRARKRGWEGQVMVAFHINSQGQLNHVRLAKSSGYSLLDHSAVAAIDRLENISLPEKLGPLQAMELLMPVLYQLRES